MNVQRLLAASVDFSVKRPISFKCNNDKRLYVFLKLKLLICRNFKRNLL